MFPKQPYGPGLYLAAVKFFIWSIGVISFISLIFTALKHPSECISSTLAGFQTTALLKRGREGKVPKNGFKKWVQVDSSTEGLIHIWNNCVFSLSAVGGTPKLPQMMKSFARSRA